ncbi:Uncharacterised protein [Mycobacteroides abscessus subsp. bolletii]|nr:Uncharacterised protein [Mycobacteroides abscessus subsp. bolletii]SHU48652.1 Uncharacterised protein [Mycobacteroides abscessus subsp. abscessus]SPX81738.1 Uncharacterised protein [Mycobacteroides abscessus]BBB40899.1 hypothetical protein MASB_14650 [Mycobacteroides abscessus subsp. bolletii BD]SHP95885.1 Uncharacterised protein [Mycobacteroides abscessus subsp. bolletii]
MRDPGFNQWKFWFWGIWIPPVTRCSGRGPGRERAWSPAGRAKNAYVGWWRVNCESLPIRKTAQESRFGKDSA